MPDAPRLLHRHSQYAYTTDPARAVHHEPEAVPAEVQAHITAAAHRAAHDAQVEQWTERRSNIVREINWLYSQRLRCDVSAQLLQLRKQVERIDKKIAG